MILIKWDDEIFADLTVVTATKNLTENSIFFLIPVNRFVIRVYRNFLWRKSLQQA